MSSYKHFATISSQVYFCSSPIRLDSYNRCQFGCTYCFSRSRSFDTSRPGLTVANPAAFSDRMARVSQGKIQSAFDEFLAARVPIQLGGLQDPFGSIELKHQVTLELLRVLRAQVPDHNKHEIHTSGAGTLSVPPRGNECAGSVFGSRGSRRVSPQTRARLPRA
jgi:DNA repair photolyase